jgi:hypothetical protein
MALWDGPHFVGWANYPMDLNTGHGFIYQLQSGVPTMVHQETIANHQITFVDGLYWATDSKMYVIGGDRDNNSLNKETAGTVWTWDGSTLVVDQTFSAAIPAFNDNFTIFCIKEFNGALYICVNESPGGSFSGGRVYRKSSPAGAWTEVHSFIVPGDGPPWLLHEELGELFVMYNNEGSPNPAAWRSPTGDPGSWVPVAGPPPSLYSGTYIFFDGTWWITGEDRPGFPFGSHKYFWANTLAGPWNGPTALISLFLLSGEMSTVGGQRYWSKFNDANIYKWVLGSWVSYRAEAGVMQASLYGPRNNAGLWDGDEYFCLNISGDASYGKNLDSAVSFGDPWFDVSSFVPTPTTPPTWDIVDIEVVDWGTGPFCDETAVGDVVVHGGFYLEIDGSSGLDNPSYYELEFGGACPALPDDWDMQIEFTATKLPKLQDFDGTRSVIWLHNTTTERKVGFYFSEQGIAVLGLDTYVTLLENSRGYVTEGDQVLLKVTGLGSDVDNQRAYISVIAAGGIFRRGFMSYNKVGAVDKLHIEATGSPERPSVLNVSSIKIKTHLFVQGDLNSIESTKPEAAIV